MDHCLGRRTRACSALVTNMTPDLRPSGGSRHEHAAISEPWYTCIRPGILASGRAAVGRYRRAEGPAVRREDDGPGSLRYRPEALREKAAPHRPPEETRRGAEWPGRFFAQIRCPPPWARRPVRSNRAAQSRAGAAVDERARALGSRAPEPPASRAVDDRCRAGSVEPRRPGRGPAAHELRCGLPVACYHGEGETRRVCGAATRSPAKGLHVPLAHIRVKKP